MPTQTPTSAAAEPEAAPIGRGRRALVWVLVVLASVLALVAILTTWVNRQMLDNQAWSQATQQVVQDPKVQAALATFTVNQLYSNVDVAQALEQRLPKDLQQLAAPLAGALQQPATQGVKALLERPRLQQLFIRASTAAHQKLVNVLENKTGYGISTGNGVVTLDLHAMLVQVGTELGLSENVLAKIPANAGTVTLMKSDQLSTAQTAIQIVRQASIWALVAVLVLFGVAISLARGIRRATLRNAGLSLALVGLVTLVIRALLGNYVTDALASPGYAPATHRLWLIGTSILGQIGAAAVLYGLVAAAGAIFAGPTKTMTAWRHRLAPVLNERQGMVWGALSFVYVLAILWGGTHALRTWWGIILLAALLATGVVALRRQTLREFPSEALAPAPATAAAGAAAIDLARLQELHEAGAIDDDEFERAKKLAPE